jgi:hypothetical protein
MVFVQIHIFDLANLLPLAVYDTVPNPKGLCALCSPTSTDDTRGPAVRPHPPLSIAAARALLGLERWLV